METSFLQCGQMALCLSIIHSMDGISPLGMCSVLMCASSVEGLSQSVPQPK